jgi:hypothetical protein
LKPLSQGPDIKTIFALDGKLNTTYLYHTNMMQQQTMLAMFAVVATIGLLGVMVVESNSIPQQQQAYASGCNNGIAFNASKGRCFGH